MNENSSLMSVTMATNLGVPGSSSAGCGECSSLGNEAVVAVNATYYYIH